MASEQTVIVLQEHKGAYTFQFRAFPLGKIPESLNGERGTHVVYVTILTEMIAKRLNQVSGKYSFTEAQISAMAAAASLHDIGKTQVPPAILNKEGSLTPVEFDIVKKHALMGEQMFRKAGKTMPPEVLRYALEIIRCHHERYDGTGYPDGLTGDQIPISAQIVSIADAYDALTTERSYKQANSQDVALEMIANGMCGVFDPLLVECLAYVVGTKALADVRAGLLQSRTVYLNTDSFVVKKVLLMGNTGYVTQEFLDNTFPQAYISLVGKTHLTGGRNLKVYRQEHPDYKAILDTYEFDLILYFGGELTYDTLVPSDAEDLRQVLRGASRVSKGSRFLYLSSLDAAFAQRNDRGVLAAAKENLCMYYARQFGIDLKILRIPYLYNGADEQDYLYELFDQTHRFGKLRVREEEQSRTYFLSMIDLSALIQRMTDSWTSGAGILTVNDEFGISFAQLCQAVGELEPKAVFEFNGRNQPKVLQSNNLAMKKQYSWFARISILAELEDEYARYLQTQEKRKGPWWERLKKRLGKQMYLLRLAELFGAFALSELLVVLTDSALFFSIVDFRMVYVVIMGTTHGLRYGLAAAALSSLSWTVAKVLSGTNWMTLFYEPTNWLSFIFFFLVGALCGYIKLKKDDTIQFLKEENRLLEEKLAFTREIYEDIFQEKRDLKKQIIGSKDSFGKIFEITRQLNSVDSRDLYLKIINNFEEVLENKTLSVYSVSDAGSRFARLEVASRDIMNQVARSVSLDIYAPVMEKVRGGEVWRNTDLVPGMPMFACGIFKEEKPLLLIFIWQAQMHQRSLYYVNLFRILCDLAQLSLIRAHQYSQAIYEKQYLPGTRIQNTETFESSVLSFRNLAERKVFQFQMLEVDPKDRPPEEMNQILGSCLRANDIMGILPDGKIGILFSQAGAEDLKFILPRFQDRGLEYVVTE